MKMNLVRIINLSNLILSLKLHVHAIFDFIVTLIFYAWASVIYEYDRVKNENAFFVHLSLENCKIEYQGRKISNDKI